MRVVELASNAQHRGKVVLTPHEQHTREVMHTLIGLGLSRDELLTRAAEQLAITKRGLKSRLTRMVDKGVRL